MFGFTEVVLISAAMSAVASYLTARHWYRSGLKDGASLGASKVLRTLKAIQDAGGEIKLGDCNCPECVADRAKVKGVKSGAH